MEAGFSRMTKIYVAPKKMMLLKNGVEVCELYAGDNLEVVDVENKCAHEYVTSVYSAVSHRAIYKCMACNKELLPMWQEK